MKILDKNFNKRSDYKNYFLQILLCKILGIIPWTKAKPEDFRTGMLELIYFLMSVAQILTFVIIVTYKRFIRGDYMYMDLIITKINCVSLSILNIYTVSHIYLYKRKEFYQFLSVFEEIDGLVDKHVYKNHKMDGWFFIKNAFFYAFLPIFLGTWQTILILGNTVQNLWWLPLELYLRYREMFVIFLVRHFIQQVGYRYEVIENILRQHICADKPDGVFRSLIAAATENEIEECLGNMFRCLNLQNELIELVQDIFGGFLLLVTYDTTLSFLFILTTGLGHSRGLSIALCIFIIQELLFVAVLASASETTINQAKKVGQTCYNSIHYIKFSAKNLSNGRKGKCLELLITILSRINFKPPVLSVNGFCEFGHKWMFAIVDSTINYLVVVLYFYNKDS